LVKRNAKGRRTCGWQGEEENNGWIVEMMTDFGSLEWVTVWEEEQCQASLTLLRGKSGRFLSLRFFVTNAGRWLEYERALRAAEALGWPVDGRVGLVRVGLDGPFWS
jgi:hypothetical protein